MASHGRALIAATVLVSCAALSERGIPVVQTQGSTTVLPPSAEERASPGAGAPARSFGEPIVMMVVGGLLVGLGSAASRPRLDA